MSNNQDNETDKVLQSYVAANGHKMIQTNPNTYWDAVCTDDCKACSEGEERPDW